MKTEADGKSSSPARRHQWRVSPTKGRAIQRRLATEVRQACANLRFALEFTAANPLPLAPLNVRFRRIWLDNLLNRPSKGAAVSDFRFRDFRRQRLQALRFPYVPGLLSFREAPALLAAWRRLRTPVDALLCDGQGIAHPLRFGLASHLGVLLGLPAVGCAKSRLIGDWVEPGLARGEHSPLTVGTERIGTVLRTRTGVKPLFVSPGHLCDFEGAADLVLRCGGGLRLPEPVRLADGHVGRFKGRQGQPGKSPR